MCLVISCDMVINQALKEDNGYCRENGKRRKNDFLMHLFQQEIMWLVLSYHNSFLKQRIV